MFPVFGGLMFVIFGTRRPTKRLRRRLNDSWAMLKPYIGENEEVLKKLKKENASVYGQALYLKKFADAPMWQNTQTTYFKSGEENFPYIIEELKKAKNFIFMEYFIIACKNITVRFQTASPFSIMPASFQ